MGQDKNEMVRLAINGHRDALESLIKSVQDRIYGLALKMLHQAPDAEDAAQEILIKIVTRLDSFRQESAFDTWAMKIATNHLLNKRKSLARSQSTFKSFEEMIVREVPDPSTVLYSKAEQGMLMKEMRIGCMQGLLQCLDWGHRVVYILGEAMGVTGLEGSAILDITPAAFRKRFSRARERIRDFLMRNCELYNGDNPRKCAPQAFAAVNEGYIDPTRLQYAQHPEGREKHRKATARLRDMEGLSREAALMRVHPDYAAPGSFVEGIRQMLASGKFQNLKNEN